MTMTVTPQRVRGFHVILRRWHKVTPRSHEAIWRFQERKMRRLGNVAYSRPVVEVCTRYDLNREEVLVTWEQALLPDGFGLQVVPDAGHLP